MSNRQLLSEVLTGSKGVTDLKKAKRIGFIYQCITMLNGVPIYEDIFGSVNFDHIGEHNRINRNTFLKATASDKTTLVFKTEKNFQFAEDIRKWRGFGAVDAVCGYHWIPGIDVIEVVPTDHKRSVFAQEDWDALFEYALTLKDDE